VTFLRFHPSNIADRELSVFRGRDFCKGHVQMHATQSAILVLILTARLVPAAMADEKVFPAGAVPEELWNEGEFTEGVAVRSDGLVFFSDIHMAEERPGQILVFDPATKMTSVYCDKSSKSNGLAFDSGDRLFACCGANGGNRSLCEILDNGDIRPLVATYNGKPLNAPNDLLIHPNGSIYFSDPRYIGPEPVMLPGMYLFRLDQKSNTVSVATKVAKKPNGVETSPDGKTLYVAETDNGASGVPGEEPGPRGLMQLLAFDIGSDGTLSNPKVLVDFGPENGIDGMAVDSSGRIFAAVRSEPNFGIGVYDSTGRQLDFLKTPTLPTNCSFGAGNDASTLYITAGGGLYKVAVNK